MTRYSFMHSLPVYGLIFLAFVWGCSGDAGLPLLSSFTASPSGQFLLNASGSSKVSRAHPFKGTADLACAHPGAHLNFSNGGAPYTVDVFAPVGGVIANINNCFDLGGGNDSFSFGIKFATHEGETVTFNLSFEPFGGRLCLDNPTFYNQYILVTEGQSVNQGTLIARMPKTDTGNDNAHIHFDLFKASGSIHCPNIFSDAVESTFAELYGTETCGGAPFPATFCYRPAAGQDLTGL